MTDAFTSSSARLAPSPTAAFQLFPHSWLRTNLLIRPASRSLEQVDAGSGGVYPRLISESAPILETFYFGVKAQSVEAVTGR